MKIEITPDFLTRLEGLAEKATQGDWVVDECAGSFYVMAKADRACSDICVNLQNSG